jgi:hypothetical protein
MVKRAPPRKRPRKAKPGTKGLGPAECRLTESSGVASAEITASVEKAGGCIVGSYKEPLGGHPVYIAILPIDAVEPTPFQRDLSDAHHKRLADVINKTGRFLDQSLQSRHQKADSGLRMADIASKPCAAWEQNPLLRWLSPIAKWRGKSWP